MIRSRILLALAVCLAAASGAAAATPLAGTGFIWVQAGDVIDVVETRVACTVRRDGVICLHVRSSKPIPGTYAAALSTNDTAALVQFGANGKPMVVARRPQLAKTTAGRVVKLRSGQAVRVKGSRLYCGVIRHERVPAVFCSIQGAKGPAPGLHAIVVSERIAALGLVDDTLRTRITVLRRQP